MEDEEWVAIAYHGFERYSVSNYGQVRNHKTGRMMSQSANQYGVVRVGLMNTQTGVQETVTVAKLVADHFVQGKSGPFNTPVNLDGDRFNNMADNLEWRPRWFAVKYFGQFEEYPEPLFGGQIQDDESRYIYESSRDAATRHGLLEYDILQSVLHGSRVFPSFQTFSRV
jgi:hypothetical protein